MGNSTVTPAKSRAPRIPITSPIPRTSFSVFNPDTPTKSPPPPSFSSNSPTFTVPDTSTSVHTSDIPTIPVPSPTFAFPVISPTHAIPVIGPSPTNPVISSTPIIPVVSPTFVFPVVPPNPTIPIVSPANEIPIESPTPTVPVISSTPEIPVIPTNSSTPEIPIVSPIPAIPSTPELPIPSPTSNTNGLFVISPDTSAVSPTLDLPSTPKTSPVLTDAGILTKSIIPPTGIHSTAPITYDVSTSPMVPFVPRTRVIPTASRLTKVASERIVSKDSISPSESTLKQAKSSTLSSVERWNKWNKFDFKQQEKYKKLSYITQRSQTVNKSTTSSSSKNINTDEKLTPIIPNIIAVPSYPLRSTAVCNPPENDYILSERTQSIHTDMSIFKYHLTYHEKKQVIGDHTKATMFKMDTRLKQTPLPRPSLSFLTKNFSDGTREIHENLTTAPSFGSLGLENDLDTESIDESPRELRLHEKQQQRKLRRSSTISNDGPDNTNYVQFVSSTIMSQPNFVTLEKPLIQNNDQPLTSILKKPLSELIDNPFPIQINSTRIQEFQKTDLENPPLTVSFYIPLSSKKASQSITRSVKLFDRKQ